MVVLDVRYGGSGDPWWTLPGNLLNSALCRLGVHGIGCRGRADHFPVIGYWHTRF